MLRNLFLYAQSIAKQVIARKVHRFATKQYRGKNYNERSAIVRYSSY